MATATLLLGIHNHQPRGNLARVLEQGIEDCYQPLLEALLRHPGIQANLHFSGTLLEALEDRRPALLDQLAQLVDRGQVELLGGPFHQPVLGAIPEPDVQGQLEMTAEYLDGRFGVRPRGMWLPLRAWEPHLPRLIRAAGYRYTLVDDDLLLAAGVQGPIHGHFVTDSNAVPLRLFPISTALRRAIPFAPVDQTVQLLLDAAQAGDGDRLLTHGDDGGKLGLWPGTRETVWRDRWLDRLFTALEAHSDQIGTARFSDAMRRQPARGQVYLPCGAFEDLGQWALPAPAGKVYQELRQHVEQRPEGARWRPFLRGTSWQGFLTKYPEANLMHKRMCHASELVQRAADRAAREHDPDLVATADRARQELYRGQCNAGYWHGYFGGVYDAHLRRAIHSHLIRARDLAKRVQDQRKPVEMTRLDLDGDLQDEVILAHRSVGIILAPARGGILAAIDDIERATCITDVLTRRPEAYHQDDRAADCAYDPHPRQAFVDQFFLASMPLERIGQCAPEERGDFKGRPYDLLQTSGGSGHVLLGRRGTVRGAHGAVPLQLTKSFQLEERGLSLHVSLTPEAVAEGLLFATELSLMLPAAAHPDVVCRVLQGDQLDQAHVASSACETSVSRIELVDPLTPMNILLKPTPAATLVRFPLQTSSRSETGVGRTYQGTTFVLLWPLRAEAGATTKLGLNLHLQ